MNTIQYAIHREDGSIISRFGSELAWPILDFEKIGKDGDFTQPLEYNLEKLAVSSVGREWRMLVWTKYVPTPYKNDHRVFWGMKPLPVEEQPKTIPALLARHSTRFYYVLDGEIGVCHGTWGSEVKLYHWFRLTEIGYLLTDLTDNVEDKHKQAKRHELPASEREYR